MHDVETEIEDIIRTREEMVNVMATISEEYMDKLTDIGYMALRNPQLAGLDLCKLVESTVRKIAEKRVLGTPKGGGGS